MTTVKEFRTGWGVLPKALPCGCRLRNKTGGIVMTHAIILKDGTRVCKCGKRWGFFFELKEFGELGLYAHRKGIHLSQERKVSDA
jgi:hypothetical protein